MINRTQLIADLRSWAKDEESLGRFDRSKLLLDAVEELERALPPKQNVGLRFRLRRS